MGKGRLPESPMRMARPSDGVDRRGHQHAPDAADEREHEALGQLVHDEAAPGGAEGGADGEVLGVGGGAGELEVRDVGARDEQHGAPEAHEQPGDHDAGAVHRGLVHGQGPEAAARAVLGVIVGPARGQRAELGLELGPALPPAEAADGGEERVLRFSTMWRATVMGATGRPCRSRADT